MNKVPYISSHITQIHPTICRIAQITDFHLFSTPKQSLLGMETRQSFEKTCQKIQQEKTPTDFLLATGDLVQDASKQAYHYLSDYLKTLLFPSFWLAGNHDKKSYMNEYLVGQNVSSNKHILTPYWQIILLDSSLPNEVYGCLLPEQLRFLNQCLIDYPEKHTLIALHHHPITIGSQWLDTIGLKNKDTFQKMIFKYSSVKGVLWGHTHQAFQEIHQNIHWMSAPSTCVQFTPKSQYFSLDKNKPGYRYLHLHSNGNIDSCIQRIDKLPLGIDYTSQHY
jgi:Icc protein